MTDPRPASGLLVSALIRRVQADGGSAMVLVKGDAIAGAIIFVFADRGQIRRVAERTWRFEGGYGLESIGPADPEAPGALSDYLARRRRSDPDIWVIELDHPTAEAIVEDLEL